jgi:hypothetical protein
MHPKSVKGEQGIECTTIGRGMTGTTYCNPGVYALSAQGTGSIGGTETWTCRGKLGQGGHCMHCILDARGGYARALQNGDSMPIHLLFFQHCAVTERMNTNLDIYIDLRVDASLPVSTKHFSL